MMKKDMGIANFCIQQRTRFPSLSRVLVPYGSFIRGMRLRLQLELLIAVYGPVRLGTGSNYIGTNNTGSLISSGPSRFRDRPGTSLVLSYVGNVTTQKG